MSYYGWNHMAMMPIITTTVGVFLIVGLCAVVYLKWVEVKRRQKVVADWHEENDQ